MPPPTAGDRPVGVAEEQVADIVVGRQHVADAIPVGAEAKPVQAGNSDAERRMVHEQVDGPVPGILERPAQPVLAPGAVAAPTFPLFDGVEHQEPSRAGLHHRLQVPVRVDGCLRKRLQQPIAPVVIADEKMRGHPQLRQTFPQFCVDHGLCKMREIARDDAKLGIPMMAIDVIDARLEAVMGVQPMQQFAARHQMRVGEVDEFHGAPRGQESVASSRLAMERPNSRKDRMRRESRRSSRHARRRSMRMSASRMTMRWSR